MKNIFTLLLVLFLSNAVFASSETESVDVNFEFKGKKFNDKADFNKVNMKIMTLENHKNYEILAIIASRPGIEFNITTSATKADMVFKKNSEEEPVHTFYNRNLSMISLKYFPGNDDIPSFTVTSAPYSIGGVTHEGEKTRQTFGFGFKNKNFWSKEEKLCGYGLVTEMGLVAEKRVHLYKSGAQYYGKNDSDAHFYFEIEPQWNSELITAGINYNTYLHQFGLKLGVNF